MTDYQAAAASWDDPWREQPQGPRQSERNLAHYLIANEFVCHGGTLREAIERALTRAEAYRRHPTLSYFKLRAYLEAEADKRA